MKCPNCKEKTLVISERKGIEIDYCPECRGIWLDRGELDKILERSREEEEDRDRDRDRDRGGRQERPDYPPAPQYGAHPGHYQKPYYKKRKSFLEELFD